MTCLFFFLMYRHPPRYTTHDTLISNTTLFRSGEFAEAERLFAWVEAMPTGDPRQLLLRRNFRAINALNQRDYDRAAALLQAPIAPIATGVTVAGDAVTLTPEIVAGVNSGDNARVIRQANDRARLTPIERAQIIDAQAVHLPEIGRASGRERECR